MIKKFIIGLLFVSTSGIPAFAGPATMYNSIDDAVKILKVAPESRTGYVRLVSGRGEGTPDRSERPEGPELAYAAGIVATRGETPGSLHLGGHGSRSIGKESEATEASFSHNKIEEG